MDWLYGLAAILSLGFLIVVHEGGHYFVARWCGMRIERFSIGFGPALFKRKSKTTGTVFQLAPIPFGGFVEIRGMNIAEEVDPDDKFAYPNRPAWQRFVTIFAGPATNYISAVVLAFVLFTCVGVKTSYRWFGVAAVMDDYDASGKLEVGDRILAVDHVPILARGEHNGVQADALSTRVNANHGGPVTLTLLRDGEQLEVAIQPKDSAIPGRQWLGRFMGDPKLADRLIQPFYLLGIAPTDQPDFIHVGVLTAAADAVAFPIDATKAIAGGLYGIVKGTEKADPGGPKRIYDEFAKAWKLGAVSGIELVMMLSVYLGLFNLFPLPALDGGRLVFLGYELVTRRRANPKIEAMIHMGGIMVLGVVMVLVTLRDFHVF